MPSKQAHHELNDLSHHELDATSQLRDTHASVSLLEDHSPRSSDILEVLHRDDLWSRLAPLAAMIVLLAVIVFQIVIVCVTVWIPAKIDSDYVLDTTDKTLDNADRTLYTTGVTVTASIVSAFVISQIRATWLKQSRDISQRQILLQIGALRDQVRLYWITIPLIVFGAITGSITGSTTISEQGRPTSGDITIAINQNPVASPCFTTGQPTGTNLTWIIDGEVISSKGTNHCNGWYIDVVNELVSLFGNAYYVAPTDGKICHTTFGGQVACSAVGAPIRTDLDCNLFYSLGCLDDARTCAPVFVKKPVACHATSNGTNGNVTVQANNLTIGYTARAGGDLTFSMSTNVLSINQLLWQFTRDINASNGNDYPDFTTDSFAVECMLSLDDAVQAQIVANKTVYPLGTGYPGTPTLYGTGEKCDGLDINNITTLSARLTAAYMLSHLIESAVWIQDLDQLRIEQSGTGGISHTTAFNDSDNTFEDLIGTYLASAMAYFWGDLSWNHYTNMPVTYTLPANRVGSGKTINVLYILPSLLALGILLYLWIAERRHTCKYHRWIDAKC